MEAVATIQAIRTGWVRILLHFFSYIFLASKKKKTSEKNTSILNLFSSPLSSPPFSSPLYSLSSEKKTRRSTPRSTTRTRSTRSPASIRSPTSRRSTRSRPESPTRSASGVTTRSSHSRRSRARGELVAVVGVERGWLLYSEREKEREKEGNGEGGRERERVSEGDNFPRKEEGASSKNREGERIHFRRPTNFYFNYLFFCLWRRALVSRVLTKSGNAARNRFCFCFGGLRFSVFGFRC